MRWVMAVDGGNTKTIAAVATADGTIVGVGRGGCSDIYGAGSAEAGCAVLEATVAAALSESGVDPPDLAASVFSLAGADWPEDFALLRTFLQDRFALADPLVVNDAIGGLRAGSPHWEGIAVVCGTANAVGARHADGRVFHLGFWPDRTGAYDLGVAALKAVYRDGLALGPFTALTARALALYGASDALDLLHRFTRRGGLGGVAGLGRSHVTRMTPVLLDVADEGDAVARAIVAEAGRWLGDQARVAASRVGLDLPDTTVVLSGGVLSHPSRLLADAILDRLPGTVPVRTRVPPIVGALLLALDRLDVTGDPEALTDQLP